MYLKEKVVYTVIKKNDTVKKKKLNDLNSIFLGGAEFGSCCYRRQWCVVTLTT